MLHKTTLLILLLFTFSSNAQMKPFVSQYYSLVNIGHEALYHDKDTMNALVYYEKALNLFLDSTQNRCHASLITDMISLSAEAGQDSLLFALIKLSILTNKGKQKPSYFEPSKWNSRKKYSSFRESEYWSYFVDSASYWYIQATIDVEPDLLALNQMYGKLDFYARSVNVNNHMNDSSCYKSSRRTLISSVDSFLYLEYIKHIKEYGIVNLEKTGKSLFGYNILIHQFSRNLGYVEFEYIDSLLLDAVYNGHLDNNMYAFLKDRSFAYHDTKSQKYGHWITTKNKKRSIAYSVQDVELVDKIRSEIGLPSLYIQSLKNNFVLPEDYTSIKTEKK